ncbi:MAG: DPP IV N-terminal domain-containing protein, partial [Candidatus Saccharicenans sp.]|nr:DPP IV N-terminal domain-containing protein [Candidatus Saccharicenans sp.]
MRRKAKTILEATGSLKIWSALFLLILLLSPLRPAAVSSTSAGEERPRLAIEKIMAGQDFIGTPPSSPVWAADGKTLYFRWKKPGEKTTEIYAVSLANPVPVKITREKILENPPLGGAGRFRGFFGFGRFGSSWQWDKNRKRLLVNQNGDIFLHDLATRKTEQLTATDQAESSLGFTFDQKKIYYQSGDNLFILSLTDRSLRQLTSFTREKQPEPPKPTDIQKWYEDQQRALFKDIFRMGFEGFGRGGGGADLLPPLSRVTTRRKPFLLAENQRLVLAEPSPDEKYVLFLVRETITSARNTIVPNYVTRSGFTETINSHTKAAENPQLTRLGIMNTENGEVRWVDDGQGERQVNPRQWLWSPDGQKCLLVAQSEDRKNAWLFLLDLASGKTTVVENVHDEAWVGSLGLTSIFWWPDSRHVSYLSEQNGYAHLYRLAVDSREKKALTEGRYEVTQAELSGDGQKVYLVTSEVHPGERHFYRLDLRTGKKTRLTDLVGMNEFYLSPDESAVAIIHSYSTVPPELYLQALAPASKPKQVTISTTEEFRAYPWYDPEIITIKARDGVEIYARLFKPDNPH